MSKLYAVTEGCYSDYTIVGLFSNKAEAEKCRDLKNGISNVYDEAQVEVFGDGAWEDMNKVLRTLYSTNLDLSNGSVLKEKTEVRLAPETDRTPSYGGSGVQTVHIRSLGGVPFAFGKSYVSKEHAHKLAVEARQEWIAGGKEDSLF